MIPIRLLGGPADGLELDLAEPTDVYGHLVSAGVPADFGPCYDGDAARLVSYCDSGAAARDGRRLFVADGYRGRLLWGEEEAAAAGWLGGFMAAALGEDPAYCRLVCRRLVRRALRDIDRASAGPHGYRFVAVLPRRVATRIVLTIDPGRVSARIVPARAGAVPLDVVVYPPPGKPSGREA